MRSTTVMALFAPLVMLVGCDRGRSVRPPTQSEPIICTREAQLCPDGSSVGRIGPDCRFAPCPPDAKNGGDPCANVELPPCPPPCDPPDMALCGQPCASEGARCGNDIGDGRVCEGGAWSCSVHAPLGMGCNKVCRVSASEAPQPAT